MAAQANAHRKEIRTPTSALGSGLWKPLNAVWGAFLFGALYILYLYIPGLGRSMQEVFKALPYVVTIIVLVFTSFRKKKEHQPPAALGLPYFREER